MYKFEYSQQPLCSKALSLIFIVLNTIEHNFHRCKKVEDSGMCSTNLPYSRDMSQGSLGAEGVGEQLNETPPQSPGVMQGSSKPSSHYASESKSSTLLQSQDHNGNCDDIEPELEAIPESPKGDSPPCQDSLCELSPYTRPAEQALVTIQKENKALVPQTAHATSTPVTANTSLVAPQAVKSRTVTTVMASQIQAFDNSFMVKIHNAEFASADMQLVSEAKEHVTDRQASSPIIVHQGDNNNGRSTGYSSSGGATTSCSSLDLNVDITMGSHGEAATIRCYEAGKRPAWPRSIDSGETFSPEETSSGRTMRQSSSDVDSKQYGYHFRPIDPVSPTKGSSETHAIYPETIIPMTDDVKLRNDAKTSLVSQSEQHFSPQSPLSMMDVITLGSPVQVDGVVATTRESPNAEITSPTEVLELPTPERLLPVGVDKTGSVKSDDHSSVSIIERVWQAFGGSWGNGRKPSSKDGNDCDLTEVVTHKANNQARTASQAEIMRDQIQTSTDEPTENSITPTNISELSDIVADKLTLKPKRRPNGWRDIPADYGWTGPTDPTASSSDANHQDPPGPSPSSIKQSSLRVGEDCMVYRCMECGEIVEEFSNEDLGMCIIILSTFVHRQPGLAAPLLPRMLKAVARVSGSEVFCWQYESFIHLPGSATSIGKQFLRCVLHQLAPNQIFNQIFQTYVEESHRIRLFKTLAQALTDFNELTPTAPIQSVLENFNGCKILPTENLGHLLSNIALYMECVGHDGACGLNNNLVPHFDTFFRKIQFCMDVFEDINPIMSIFISIFKIQGVSQHKSILEPISKIISYAIQNGYPKYEYLNDLCYLCNRTFTRERDKLLISRLVVYELVQALKFKTCIPDTNLVILTQLVVQDSGGTVGSNNVIGNLLKDLQEIPNLQNNCTAECMRPHFQDGVDFISDVHTLSKVKLNCTSNIGLNEDTIGGVVKSGIAQFLALECARASSSKDARSSNNITKLLPWLSSSPTASNQGPKEFIECVSHIRVLSWVLLGALSHTCHKGYNNGNTCQPVPPEASCVIADHIQIILSGFPEQSKASVMHMSSLFHAFILCQLWTVYLEHVGGSPSNDNYNSICAIMTDFWAKVTPGILQIVSHSKVLGEMVSLHFLSLMEALQECQSSVLTKLLPLWAPVLYTHNPKLTGQVAVRLQTCQDAAPYLDLESVKPITTSSKNMAASAIALPNLLAWLHRLQFKMGQIELQSSAATQFYSV